MGWFTSDWFGGAGAGTTTVYSLPVPPTPTTGSTSIYRPAFSTGPSGKHPTEPWDSCVVDGVQFFCNGYDQPWWWDEGSNFYDLGGAAPTDFSLALSAAGAPAAIPTGKIARYYVVRAVSSLGKETAPQLAGASDAYFAEGVPGISISNASGATRDVTVTWTPDTGGQFDVRRIYRSLDGEDAYKLVKEVAEATGTYLDVDPDANIETNTAYVRTYRTTAPPLFDVMWTHQNRVWGAAADSAVACYGQIARDDARDVTQDFPDANVLMIEINDPFGGIRAGWSHNDFNYVFREEAVYQVDGQDATDFVVTRMYSGRGALCRRAMIEIDDGQLVVLDKLGLYGWSPGGQPVVLGKANATGLSRLAPIWKRMNLGAARHFHVVHEKDRNLLHFFIALDFEPVPNYVVVYDYKRDVFLTDPYVWSGASGLLEDSSGAEHRVRLDDVGVAWVDGVGNSDGVYAGATTATITAAPAWTCAETFDTTDADGTLGSAAIRYTSAGVAIEVNRIAVVGAHTLVPLYWNSTAVANGQLLAVGAIPSVAQSGKRTFTTDGLKQVTNVVVEHDVEASSSYTLYFRSAPDDVALAAPPVLTSIDLSANKGRTPIAVSDRGWTWRWELSQSLPGMSWAVRALSIHYDVLGTPR